MLDLVEDSLKLVGRPEYASNTCFLFLAGSRQGDTMVASVVSNSDGGAVTGDEVPRIELLNFANEAGSQCSFTAVVRI